jgi:hypothetical protein
MEVGLTIGSPEKRRPFRMDGRTKVFVLGALLAAAFFLMEAGIAEIMIATDQECRGSIASVRLAPDPFQVCASEWQWYLVRALSRGVVWVFNQDSAPFIGWITMGLIYSFVGGASAQTFRSRGFVAFLIVQIGMVAALMGLGYFRQFIA